MVTAVLPPSGGRRGRRHDRGYTLVVVAMLVTVMTIAVAVVLPVWSTQIRREREEELVFRGLQYAEAIRIFQRRFGRFPNDLKELVEVKPRSIRQLWGEPLTEDGKWIPIRLEEQQMGGAGLGPDGRPLDPETERKDRARKGDPEVEQEDQQIDEKPPAPGDPQPVGPIIGVRSGNSKAAFRTFFGQENYRQWRFTYDLVVPGGAPQVPGVGVPGAVGGGVPTVPRAAWIGRPLPGVDGMPNMPNQQAPLPPGVQQPGYPPGIGVPRGKPVPPDPGGREKG